MRNFRVLCLGKFCILTLPLAYAREQGFHFGSLSRKFDSSFERQGVITHDIVLARCFALAVAPYLRLRFQRRDVLRGIPAPNDVPFRVALAR